MFIFDKKKSVKTKYFFGVEKKRIQVFIRMSQNKKKNIIQTIKWEKKKKSPQAASNNNNWKICEFLPMFFQNNFSPKVIFFCSQRSRKISIFSNYYVAISCFYFYLLQQGKLFMYKLLLLYWHYNRFRYYNMIPATNLCFVISLKKIAIYPNPYAIIQKKLLMKNWNKSLIADHYLLFG